MSALSEENTARLLANRPLVAGTACKFGWHKWQLWEKVEEFSYAGDKMVRYHRHCDSCGMPQSRTIKIV